MKKIHAGLAVVAAIAIGLLHHDPSAVARVSVSQWGDGEYLIASGPALVTTRSGFCPRGPIVLSDIGRELLRLDAGATFPARCFR